MIRSHCLSLLVSLATILVSPTLVSADTCAERFVAASAVRTRGDVQAFVQCAYEFVQEVGFVEARRAFHEDKRWKDGANYIFVSEDTPVSEKTRSLVFPPDPSREGRTITGLLNDAFGNNYYKERNRILSLVGEGWIYYAFTNPATGRDEPKASYVKALDWDGIPAAIGSGIYRRDLPGTCWSEEVNAMGLEEDPSPERLQEFVRCAAMELESNGYFASVSLANDPRWRSGSIYLFGLDTYGYTLFTGSPANPLIGSELSSDFVGSFGGRNVLGVANAFGETFLYYSNRNPATNQEQRKVTFVKRVTSFGVPVLIGAGYYLDGAVSTVPGDGTASPPSQAGRVVVAGADATLGDDDFVLNSATITGDTLTISVSYSGGCKTHEFTLVIAASFIETSPVRLPAVLRHDANGDSCEAFPTESYAFDLALVKARYREAYGPGRGTVVLQLDGVPGDGLVYEFTE